MKLVNRPWESQRAGGHKPANPNTNACAHISTALLSSDPKAVQHQDGGLVRHQSGEVGEGSHRPSFLKGNVSPEDAVVLIRGHPRRQRGNLSRLLRGGHLPGNGMVV